MTPTDREQIERLVYGYAERIDAGDFEGVADLLAYATLTSEGSELRVIGRDQVLGLYTRTTRRYPDGTPRSRHVTTNLIIEFVTGELGSDAEADQATARSYFTVLQAVPGLLALQPIIAGGYRDRFERVDDQWRFSARHITVDLVGELGHHLLFDLEQ